MPPRGETCRSVLETAGPGRRGPTPLIVEMRQATPAAFSVARTFAAVIGASRMRTPVASKNAFATAEPGGTVGGSPAPVAGQPALMISVFAAVSDDFPWPGVITVWPLGWTIAIVTAGLSLKRRIGYVTQSVLVIRSFVNVSCS